MPASEAKDANLALLNKELLHSMSNKMIRVALFLDDENLRYGKKNDRADWAKVLRASAREAEKILVSHG